MSNETECLLECLVGKTIQAIWIGNKEQWLAFDTDAGRVVFMAEGDCCSESWFADIIGVDALIGGKVLSAEDIIIEPTCDGRCRQDYDEFYGHRLTTDKGRADIIYRNSSNGYYGGWLAIDKKTNRLIIWRQITDDFSA